MGVLNGFYIIPRGLYRYTIHGRRREMGAVYALRDAFLKQAREFINQWRSVLREHRKPIKERNKKSVKQ